MVTKRPRSTLSRRHSLALIGAVGIGGITRAFAQGASVAPVALEASLATRLANIEKNREFFAAFWKYHPAEYRHKLMDHFAAVEPSTLVSAEKMAIHGRIAGRSDDLVRAYEGFKNAYFEARSDSERLYIAENLAMLSEEAGVRHPYFRAALRLARKTRQAYKAKIYEAVSNGAPLAAQKVSIRTRLEAPRDTRRIRLGKTRVAVAQGSRIGSQTDRVLADWYSAIYPDKFSAFPLSTLVGWHEGKMVREILKPYAAQPDAADIVHSRGTGRAAGHMPQLNVFFDTFACLNEDGMWYAPDDTGTPRFEVLVDKIQYPSSKRAGDWAYLVDTHGISSLVAQSLQRDVDLVIGCGDSPAKMQAAYYLAQQGVDVFFGNDRYIGDVLGHDASGTLIGTAPVKQVDGNAVIGDQPIEFDVDETIVVQDTAKAYPAQYYDAPRRYFMALKNMSGLALNLVRQDVDDIRQSGRVTERAIAEKALIIGVRVAYEEDYMPVRNWLATDARRRAVLFHSASYDPGYRLFSEFPEQTSFGDTRPEFLI